MPCHAVPFYVIIVHLPRLLSFRTHFFSVEDTKKRAIVFKQKCSCVCAGSRTFSQCISMCAFSLSALLCVQNSVYTRNRHTLTLTSTGVRSSRARHLLIVSHTHTSSEWGTEQESGRVIHTYFALYMCVWCMLCQRVLVSPN